MVTNRHMIICKPTKLSIVIVTRDFDPHSYIRFGSYLEDYRVKDSKNTKAWLILLDSRKSCMDSISWTTR